MRVDQALQGNPFSIDELRCYEAGRTLSRFQTRAEKTAWHPESLTSQLAFKVLFISICHQFNWDFLQGALASWLLPNADVRLDEFAAAKPAQIKQLLAGYAKQERVRPNERAKGLRDTAKSLQGLLAPGGGLHALIERPVLDGKDGFYSVIREVTAFRGDILDKKARVLAHDLYRENILNFTDPENLKPAVEYHLIRLYLRTGRVFPTKEAIRDELRGANRPARRRLVMLLRQTVDQAMQQTALFSGLNMAELNYVEWQLARSVCIAKLNNKSHNNCYAPPNDELPIEFHNLLASGCPFSSSCRALGDSLYDWFHEPQFEKSIY
jgi:hypothetical protein